MVSVSKEMTGIRPCPLYEEGFTNHCTDCFERQECIMLTVLGKLQRLENRID